MAWNDAEKAQKLQRLSQKTTTCRGALRTWAAFWSKKLAFVGRMSAAEESNEQPWCRGSPAWVVRDDSPLRRRVDLAAFSQVSARSGDRQARRQKAHPRQRRSSSRPHPHTALRGGARNKSGFIAVVDPGGVHSSSPLVASTSTLPRCSSAEVMTSRCQTHFCSRQLSSGQLGWQTGSDLASERVASWRRSGSTRVRHTFSAPRRAASRSTRNDTSFGGAVKTKVGNEEGCVADTVAVLASRLPERRCADFPDGPLEEQAPKDTSPKVTKKRQVHREGRGKQVQSSIWALVA